MAGQFNVPRYQEWSLQLEQQLDSKSSVSLAYIGNHGIHETVPSYPNSFLAGGTAGNSASLPYAPYSPTNYSTVLQYYTGAVSNDNQITTTYQRRLTYGFTIQASYTWAHALDEISNGGNLGYSSSSQVYQYNPLNLRNNYGNADYDIRSSFNAQYVWNTPFKFGNKYVQGAIGGWTLSQNFFARSGLPLTAVDGDNPLANTPGPSFLPAQVVGIGQSGCGTYYQTCFNSGAFNSLINPNTGVGLSSFPNQLRNQYRGPGFFDSDFSINKNFKLTERVAFGVGANFYNVFNHPNFAQPNNTVRFGHLRCGLCPDGSADRSFRIVLRGSPCEPHHPVPGQDRLLVRATCFT